MRVELAPDDGRQPQSRDGVAGKARQATADQGSDFVRDAKKGIPSRFVERLERVAGRQQPDDLLKEVRVAARDFVQPRDGFPAHRRSGHRRDVRLDVRRRKAPEHDPRSDPREFREEVRQLAHALLGLPIGSHEQDPRLGQRVPEEAQQQQGRLVRRVQVVHYDEDRAVGGGRRQEAANRVEQAQPLAFRHDRGRRRALGGRGAGGRDELLEIASQSADDLKPRPVRRGAALLPAATGGDAHPSPGAEPGELARQPGLADTRLARHEDQRAAAGRGLLERGLELA